MVNNLPQPFSISMESILKVIAVLLGVWFLWLVRDIIALFFVALILSAAFDPLVDYLRRYKIPRGVSVIFIYIVFISLISLVIIQIAGPIADEVRNMAQALPRLYSQVNRDLNQFQADTPLFADRMNTLRGGLDDVITNLTRLASGNILAVISSFFGGVVSVLLLFVITFYLVVQEDAFKKFVIWLVPQKQEGTTAELMDKIQHKMGRWVSGQLVLSFIIFLVTYIGLKILGIQYALSLALLAGLFEAIPYLGPILSAIPAVFLTMASQGLVRGLLVLALYALIQQAENNLIVPRVMAKSVGLNPLVVILSILIGAKLAGVVGAVIAVPLATAATVYLQERWHKGEVEA